jgi:hypothetical protein
MDDVILRNITETTPLHLALKSGLDSGVAWNNSISMLLQY